MHMVTIRSEWVNFPMGSILIWELRDVFQCEYLAFYLAEMFKGTLCRKITFNILFNNLIIIFWRMSLIIYEKKSLKIMLTRLGIFNLTMSYQLSGKNYLRMRLTTQPLFFSFQIFSLGSWSMISSTIKTYLKTYLKTKGDNDKNDEEEKGLKWGWNFSNL